MWDGNRNEEILPKQVVFHRLPKTSRVFTINPEELEGEYLSLRTPNISVTWKSGDDVLAHDALLQIDGNGYRRIIEGHGVVQFVVDQLLYVEDFDERSFAASVEHVPYSENKAHAEVWICDVEARPVDWRASGGMKKPPSTIRKRWRRVVTSRVIDAWMAGNSPIALCPDSGIEFG